MNTDKRPINISIVVLNRIQVHFGIDNFAALGIMIEQPFWVEICVLWLYCYFGFQDSDRDVMDDIHFSDSSKSR